MAFGEVGGVGVVGVVGGVGAFRDYGFNQTPN